MKKLIWFIVIVGGLYLIYYLGGRFNSNEYNKIDNQVVSSSKSELEKIMEDENFHKITVLRARKVANDNKKAIEVERNKQAMSAIEAEYEAIRAEELQLVGDKDVSLK